MRHRYLRPRRPSNCRNNVFREFHEGRSRRRIPTASGDAKAVLSSTQARRGFAPLSKLNHAARWRRAGDKRGDTKDMVGNRPGVPDAVSL